jgi:DNA topoisomerase VI subunit A
LKNYKKKIKGFRFFVSDQWKKALKFVLRSGQKIQMTALSAEKSANRRYVAGRKYNEETSANRRKQQQKPHRPIHKFGPRTI